MPYSKVTENQNILQVGKPSACYTVTTRGIFVKWNVKGAVVGIDVWKTALQGNLVNLLTQLTKGASRFEQLFGPGCVSVQMSLLRIYPLTTSGLDSAPIWVLTSLNCLPYGTFAIPVGKEYMGDRKPVIHTRLGPQRLI